MRDSSEDQVGRGATADAVVRLALARGWLTQPQVEGALRTAAAQGLSLAQLLARHRPDAAPELAVLGTLAGPAAHAPASTVAGAPPPASSSPGVTHLPAPEDAGRTHVVAALRQQLARDPRFAPHLDLVLERRGVLGEGGMGVVHRVLDRRLGRLAALKVMKTEEADPQDVARFFREAELTARLDHPSVPPVYEAGTDAAGRPYLLMRLIEGQPLSERIAGVHHGGHAPALHEVRELVEVLVKVGEAVARAHARGMVHRDLKPGNVMVGAHGEVLVLDWGLVRVLDGPDDDALLRAGDAPAPTGVELTQAGSLLGTPGYMSPEQAGGELPVDARTDVFALGAILCAILTGRPPIEGQSVMNIVTRTVQGVIARPRDRWRGCPRELDSIAAAALAADRDARTASAEAFVADLRAWLAGEDVPSHRYGALERLGRAARRRPAAVVTIAALALVAGISARAQAEVAQRQRFQGAMHHLVDAEGLAVRGAASDAAAAVTSALLLGGDAVRWHAARVLDLAGRPADGVLLLDPMIVDTARPPPLEAVFFLHVLQVHAAPEALGLDRRTLAMTRLHALAPFAPPEDALRAFVEGTVALERDDLVTARRRLDDALRRSPRLGWALVDRAEVLRRQNHYRLAGADLDEAVKAGNADPSVLVAALLARADLRLALGREREALADAEQALALAPGLRLARVTHVRALVGVGRCAEARAVIEQLMAEHTDADLFVVRARARMKQGDQPGALADVASALALAPRSADALAERAGERLDGGDVAGAVLDVDALLEVRPEDARTQLLAAVAHLRAGHEAKGLEHLERAVTLGRDLRKPLHVRAVQRRKAGDLVGARKDLDDALALAPGEGDTLIERALLRGEEKDLDGMAADLDAGLALSPENSNGRRMRALLRAQRGDLDGAIRDVDVLRDGAPRDPSYQTLRAQLDLQVNDLGCAERHARRAVELGGGAVALTVAGQVALRLGQHREVITLARQALELDPERKEAQALLAAATLAVGASPEDAQVLKLVEEGMKHLMARDFAAAEELATRAIEQAPRAGSAWTLRSRARGYRGDGAGAIADADRAVEASPRSADAWFQRACARVVTDPAGALADIAEALTRDPGNFAIRFTRAQALANLKRYDECLVELDGLLGAMNETHPQRRQTEQFRDRVRRAAGK